MKERECVREREREGERKAEKVGERESDLRFQEIGVKFYIFPNWGHFPNTYPSKVETASSIGYHWLLSTKNC